MVHVWCIVRYMCVRVHVHCVVHVCSCALCGTCEYVHMCMVYACVVHVCVHMCVMHVCFHVCGTGMVRCAVHVHVLHACVCLCVWYIVCVHMCEWCMCGTCVG